MHRDGRLTIAALALLAAMASQAGWAQQAGKPGKGGKNKGPKELPAILIFDDDMSSPDRVGSENLLAPLMISEPAYVDGAPDPMGPDHEPMQVEVWRNDIDPSYNFFWAVFPEPKKKKGGTPGTSRQVFIDLSDPAGAGIPAAIHPFAPDEARLLRIRRFRAFLDDCLGNNVAGGYLEGFIGVGDTLCARTVLFWDDLVDPKNNGQWEIGWSRHDDAFDNGLGSDMVEVTCLDDADPAAEVTCTAWRVEPHPVNNMGDLGRVVNDASGTSVDYHVPFGARICLLEVYGSAAACGAVPSVH